MKRLAIASPPWRTKLAEGTAPAVGLRLVPRADVARPTLFDQLSIADFCARVIIVALFSMMAIRIWTDFLETGRLTGLLLLASELLVDRAHALPSSDGDRRSQHPRPRADHPVDDRAAAGASGGYLGAGA